MNFFPTDYLERAYAGVLGKVIGVYLGRPFEGWDHARIASELGEVDRYQHEKLGQPLVVTDDDLSGTFTFLRALSDNGCDPHISSAQVGETWLNYIIPERTILWWGGCGRSTEHTAYLRLQSGIEAPESGSIARNGRLVAEQIGAQIFIDGWGLVNPGDPERAAAMAAVAGRVSHDGVAVECAQVVAAMVAAAFTATDVAAVIASGLAVIPKESMVRKLIDDVSEWHGRGLTWQEGFAKIQASYGYDRYGGGCHVIPNHALIHHGLLHGGGDFTRSLMVTNTCGWDTDCNSGNVGCIVGVLGGLAGIGPEWRDPVRDRLLLPTADGGRAITDAAIETLHIARIARVLHGQPHHAPKDGARFHFSLPGSVQGFSGPGVTGPDGLEFSLAGGHVRTTTPTFTSPAQLEMPGYGLVASPTLVSGQRISAYLEAGASALEARICIGAYGHDGGIHLHFSEPQPVPARSAVTLEWEVPPVDGFPIAEVGVDVRGEGTFHLHWLTWSGEPNVELTLGEGGAARRAAWVDGVDHWERWDREGLLVQNHGVGLLIQGTQEWRDYSATSTLRSNLSQAVGLAGRVQGMRRYYAILVGHDQMARLVRVMGETKVLVQAPFPVVPGADLMFELSFEGDSIRGRVNDVALTATDAALKSGAVAYVISEGNLTSAGIRVRPNQVQI